MAASAALGTIRELLQNPILPNVKDIRSIITDETNFLDNVELGLDETTFNANLQTHDTTMKTNLTNHHELVKKTLLDHDVDIKDKVAALQTAVDVNTAKIQFLRQRQLEAIRLMHVVVANRTTEEPACNDGPCAYPEN